MHVVKTRANYNIVLGKRWLHDYAIIPSTLHQCFKYMGNDEDIHRVFADKKPFKGKEAYVTDVAMYMEREAHSLSKGKSKATAEDKGKAKKIIRLRLSKLSSQFLR